VPESPRWLVTRGDETKALSILRRLHRDPKDPQDGFARKELALIHKQITHDKVQVQEQGRWQMITQETYRKRLILACVVIIGTQNTAILVRRIPNYLADTILTCLRGHQQLQHPVVSVAWLE
jgi:hypothetical protein